MVRDRFLLSLNTKLCKRVDASIEDYKTMKECDVMYKPLRGRGTWRESKKNKNIGEKGKNSWVGGDEKSSTLLPRLVHLLVIGRMTLQLVQGYLERT